MNKATRGAATLALLSPLLLAPCSTSPSASTATSALPKVEVLNGQYELPGVVKSK